MCWSDFCSKHGLCRYYESDPKKCWLLAIAHFLFILRIGRAGHQLQALGLSWAQQIMGSLENLANNEARIMRRLKIPQTCAASSVISPVWAEQGGIFWQQHWIGCGAVVVVMVLLLFWWFWCCCAVVLVLLLQVTLFKYLKNLKYVIFC